ncbi:MAG: hypothetical protein AAF605_07455 [Myxococcota bacterium]
MDTPSAYAAAILGNIAASDELFHHGQPPALIGTVSGSAAAQRFWQERLDRSQAAFGAKLTRSLYEDLPVNQAFGLLLLWQRVREDFQRSEGALFAFVFGEGSRATPFTEAECGQKPALASFARSQEGSWLSVVELALRAFAPVESFLRRSGFDGLVVKWGDEIQIPTRALSAPDARFANADVVRFVSMREMNAADSANKDWVGVDEHGAVTAFVPRRPLSDMERLADRGVLQRRNGRLFGGVNLGSIAVSRRLLDLLLEEFEADVNDADAERKSRPDLDPQLFTALSVACKPPGPERNESWKRAQTESAAIRELTCANPDVFDRLCAVIDRFENQYARRPYLAALDFEDQYWGDIGQHRQMYDLYMALREDSERGVITRALAELTSSPDASGNVITSGSVVGASVSVQNSVLIDVEIAAGSIEDSVLIGTRCHRMNARSAFDVQSCAPVMELAPRAGCYKVVAAEPVRAAAGERVASVFLADQAVTLRVHEDTDLRDRALHYDVPIGENPMAFADAHREVLKTDPASVEERRRQKSDEVARGFGKR